MRPGFVLSEDSEALIAWAMGQALPRLADWQADMLADALTDRGSAGDKVLPDEALWSQADAAQDARGSAELRLAGT